MSAKKTVSFSVDVIDPPTPDQCHICKYRNIKPQIRQMDYCEDCEKQTCLLCLTNMKICLTCDRELFSVIESTNL